MSINSLKRVPVYFCQTCKDRTSQAIQTLPQNLQAVKSFNAQREIRGYKHADFRFIVVDYGDPDEIYQYILSEHYDFYLSGCISVFHVKNPPAWRMATVKNIAVRCGIALGAEYIVSLDIDNFVTHEEMYLLSSLAAQGIGYHGARNIKDGTTGRIGCSSQQFMKLNGFREDSPPVGKHDVEFVYRLSKKCPLVHLPSLASPIFNHKSASIKHTVLSNINDYRKSRRCKYSDTVPSMSTQLGDLYHRGKHSKDIKI